MTAVRALVPSLLRRGWRGAAVVAILVAVATGAILTAWAGARRDASAFDRAETAVHAADITVVAGAHILEPHFTDIRRVATLPQVRRSGVVLGYGLAALEHGVPNPDKATYFAPAATDPRTLRSYAGALLEHGRSADPSRPDEVVVTASTGFHVGDHVTLALFRSSDLVAKADQLQRERRGPTAADFAEVFRNVRLHVVGVGRSPSTTVTGGDPTIALTPAFARLHRASASYMLVYASLRPGGSERALANAARAAYPDVPLTITSDREARALFSAAEQPVVDALRIFAAVVALISALFLGQTLVRMVRSDATDLPTWRALGCSGPAMAVTSAARAALAGCLGAVAGVVAALVASRWFPTGIARAVEPAPGIRADHAVLWGGLAAVVIGAAGCALLAGWRAARRDRIPRSAAAPVAPWLPSSRNPARDLGIRRALFPAAAGAASVTTAIVGLTVATLTVTVALTFASGLDRLVTRPATSGWTWSHIYDATDGTLSPSTVHAVVHDPAVEAATVGTRANLTVRNALVPTYAFSPRRGEIQPVVRAGRLPDSPDEIALGPVTRHAIRAGLGARVRVVGQHGGARRLRVVGDVVLPPRLDFSGSQRLGEGGVVTPSGLRRLTPGVSPSFALLDLSAAAPRAATLVARWNDQGSISTVGRPVQIRAYADVRSVPPLLAGLLLFLGLAVLAHAFVTTVRRDGQQFAVLRVIGFTRGQVRRVLTWQAFTMTAAASVVGVTVGLVVAARLWHRFADSLGVDPRNALPVVGAIAVALLAVALGIAVARVIAARATRTTVGRSLRVE